MFEIQAENRDLTERATNQPKETHKRGCYLALTFGTLLSSQGADAQQRYPLGFGHWRLCPTVRRSRRCSPSGFLRGPSGPARRNRENVTRPGAPLARGVPSGPTSQPFTGCNAPGGAVFPASVET